MDTTNINVVQQNAKIRIQNLLSEISLILCNLPVSKFLFFKVKFVLMFELSVVQRTVVPLTDSRNQFFWEKQLN